jgi:protein ImuB
MKCTNHNRHTARPSATFEVLETRRLMSAVPVALRDCAIVIERGADFASIEAQHVDVDLVSSEGAVDFSGTLSPLGERSHGDVSGSWRPGVGRTRVEGPWPGALPTPSPAWVHHDPVPAELVDADGESLSVSGRGALSAPPVRLSADGGPWLDVIAWAGPWPLVERWWDAARWRRRARLQLVTVDGHARLATLERGAWKVEATYD